MARAPLFPIALLLALAACGDAKRPAEASAVPAAAVPAAAAPVFDPVADAAKSYRVGAALTPADLKKGARGQLAIDIEMTRTDVHVQREFPLKATLAPSAGLRLAKDSLGHADAADPSAAGRGWKVPLTAAQSGPQEVDVALRFAICKESEPAWCVVRNDTVTASVEVR